MSFKSDGAAKSSVAKQATVRAGSNDIKLDHSGLPLIPQPTASPFDPLNYPDVSDHLIPLSRTPKSSSG